MRVTRRAAFAPAAVLTIGIIASASGCGRRGVAELEPPPAEAPVSPAAIGSLVPATMAAEPAAEAEGAAAECPDGMVLVEGAYCPKVEHRCLRYLDAPGTPFGDFRCAEYAQPAKCLAERRQMRFCIDRDEYTQPGEALPANYQSWTHADRACRADGKRVCLESEWNFACEGEDMRPYPYGFTRDSSACNADLMDLINKEGKLKDLRAPSSAYPRCVSPFGVRNMAGNLEEFVTRDRTTPTAPAMKGAYWQPSRNFCRAAQTAHDRFYNGMETGFRCCADVPGERSPEPPAR